MIRVYVITNTVNDKVYIGQTVSELHKRFAEHKNDKKGYCKKLFNALNKYGRDQFSVNLLVICDNQMTADYLEKFWIKTYDSISNGYNIKEGGLSGKHPNRKRPPPFTEEHLANLRKSSKHGKPMQGRKHSKETREKMSKAAKQRINASVESKNKHMQQLEAARLKRSNHGY